MSKKLIALQLDTSLLDKLSDIAKSQDRSLSSLIRIALYYYLEKEEYLNER